jgi:RNA polymerase sigma-70 factor (ECF subfamily)
MRIEGTIPQETRMGAVVAPSNSESIAALVAAARQGSPEAFRQLTEPHRPELHLHCYRMMGSLHDAEDAIQETLLRVWRSLRTLRVQASFRAWLYRVATNVCLDTLRHRSRRVLPTALRPAADPGDAVLPDIREPIWLEPYPTAGLHGLLADPAARYELRESVSLAFVAAIQYLAPRQRAVLILRNVLGWSAADTAKALKSSVPAVNSALQRARAVIKAKRPAGGSFAVVPADAAAHRVLVERYMQAWEAGDADALAELLAQDAIMTMPPSPSWYEGREAIAAFHARIVFDGPFAGRLHLVPVEANYLPAFAVYRDDAPAGRREAFALKVLSVRDGRVAWVAGFADPSLFRLFGLPQVVPVERGNSTIQPGG